MSLSNQYDKDEVSSERHLARRLANYISVEMARPGSIGSRDEVEELSKMIEEELNVIKGNMTREELNQKLGLENPEPDCPHCGERLEHIATKDIYNLCWEHDSGYGGYIETSRSHRETMETKCPECEEDISDFVYDNDLWA